MWWLHSRMKTPRLSLCFYILPKFSTIDTWFYCYKKTPCCWALDTSPVRGCITSPKNSRAPFTPNLSTESTEWKPSHHKRPKPSLIWPRSSKLHPSTWEPWNTKEAQLSALQNQTGPGKSSSAFTQSNTLAGEHGQMLRALVPRKAICLPMQGHSCHRQGTGEIPKIMCIWPVSFKGACCPDGEVGRHRTNSYPNRESKPQSSA